jgi:hypothetical protein
VKNASQHLAIARLATRVGLNPVTSILAILLSTACSVSPSSEQLESVTGMYHIPAATNAFNIIIREDGSFEWDACYCDGNGGGRGRVRLASGRLELELDVGNIAFPCLTDDASGTCIVRDFGSPVVLDSLEDGGISTSADGVTLEWAPGWVCAICDSSASSNDNGGPLGFEQCGCLKLCHVGPIAGVPLCPGERWYWPNAHGDGE